MSLLTEVHVFFYGVVTGGVLTLVAASYIGYKVWAWERSHRPAR